LNFDTLVEARSRQLNGNPLGRSSKSAWKRDMEVCRLRSTNTGVNLLILVLVALLLTSCDLWQGEGGPIPTLGPMQTGGEADDTLIELTSTTNCAEIGEVVTFTVRIANHRKTPATFTGTPLFDVVIRPAKYRLTPVQRWSESNQYPATINPVFAPGEERTYQWHWTADAIYAPAAVEGNGVEVTLTTAYFRSDTIFPQGGSLPPFVIGVMSRNLPNGAIRCAEMRR
jgi:hypothetical protein